MKKFIAALLLIGLTSFSNAPVKTYSKVYICVSSSAYVYHDTKECRGLNSCTHTIKAVSEQEAMNDYGRRKCKVCF